MKSNIILKAEDFFRIFRNRVRISSDAYHLNSETQNVIFKETIDTLERLDKFVAEIDNGLWDEKVLLYKFEVEKDPRKMQYFCKSLNELRICKELFRYPENFINYSFKKIYKIYEQFDLELRLVALQANSEINIEDLKFKEQKESFIYSIKSNIQPWKPDDLPLNQAVRLIKNVQSVLSRDRSVCTNIRKSTVQQLNELEQIFDQLIVQHVAFYVFVVDIHLSNFWESRSLKFDETRVDIQLKELNQIRLKIQQLPDYLASWTKIETDGTITGLNLHCILFLKSNKNYSEQDIINILEKRIHSTLEGSQNVEIRNWNEVIRRHYSKDAVGLIKRSQTASISEFKYWILGYFVNIDFYLKASMPEFIENNIQINEVNMEVSFKFQDVESTNNTEKSKKSILKNIKLMQKSNEKLKENLIISNEPFLKSINSKTIWDTKHLSQLSQDYIKSAKLYYIENIDNFNDTELLIKIEIFIETLLHSKCSAFELSVSPETLMPLNKSMLKNSATRIGLQFISIGEIAINLATKFHLHQPLIQLDSLSKSTSAFQMVNDGLPPNNFVQLLNEHTQDLRNEFTRELVEFRNTSISKYKLYKYKQYRERLDVVSALVKQLFKQDCIVYKVALEAEPMTQKQLSKLFTGFLHYAERSKPLYWKIGHFGLWRESNKGYPYADVFFILDKRAFNYAHSVVDKLNGQWVEFIKKEIQKLGDNYALECKKYQVQGKPISIKNLEYALEYLLIETSNKRRKLDFLEQVLPAFLMSDVFEANPRLRYPKTLIKSSMMTTTVKQNKT